MRSVLYSDEGASLPAVSTSGGGCLGLFNSASQQQSSLRQWYNRLLACVTNSWRGDFGKVLLRIQCFGDTGVAFREGRPRAALCKVRIHWCSAMADQELSF